jgi:hypothetical protein
MLLVENVGADATKQTTEPRMLSTAGVLTMFLLLGACGSSSYEPPASSWDATSDSGCSDEERNLVRSYSEAIASGNIEGATALGQELSANVTPACLNELQVANTGSGGYAPTQGGYAPTQGGYAPAEDGPVIDHGNGTYSTSEGYCDSSGCGAFGTSAPDPSDD